jgi:hypothetical protein
MVDNTDDANPKIDCWLHPEISLTTTQMKFVVYWLVRPYVLATLYTFCKTIAHLHQKSETTYASMSNSMLRALSTFQTKVSGSTETPTLQLTATDYQNLNEQTTTTGREVTWEHMQDRYKKHEGLDALCEISNEKIMLKIDLDQTNITEVLNARNLRFLFVWVFRVIVSKTLSAVTFEEHSDDISKNMSHLIHVSHASSELVQEVRSLTPAVDTLPQSVADTVPSAPKSVEAPSRHQVRTIFVSSKFNA